MRYFWAIVGLASIWASLAVHAQDQTGEAAKSVTDAALSGFDPFAAERSVDEQIQAYLASRSGQNLQAQAGKIWSSYVMVSKTTGSADWGMLRTLAYDRAWSKVQEDFIRWQYQEVQDTTVRRLFEDASSGIPSYEPSSYTGNESIDEFIEKSGVYVSAKLDAALKEAGVDPETYSRGNKKQRKELLVDAITQTTLTKSYGTLGGLLPVMTFSGSVDGQEAIGVVGAYRPEHAELAREIAGRRPILSAGASSKPLAERIPGDPSQLLGSFGVRVLRDEHGYPLLMAFGQSALSRTSASPAVLSSLRHNAIGRARNAADRAMAQFVGGTATYTDESTLGDSLKSYVDVSREGYLESADEIEFTSIREQFLETKAKSALSGVSNLREWAYKHPETGHILVGVVRVWSPVEASRAMTVRSGGQPKVRNERQQGSTEKPVDKESQGPSWSVGSPDFSGD